MPNVQPPTVRQLQGLELTALGLTQSVIARCLNMSKAALDRDQARLRRAVGAVNTSHAIAIGYETGLLRVGEKLWLPDGLTVPNRTAEVA